MIDIQELLDNIADAIEDDPVLDDEMRDDALDLVDAVSEDPSPENLKALYIVVAKLRDANKYLSALENLESVEASNDLNEEEDLDENKNTETNGVQSQAASENIEQPTNQGQEAEAVPIQNTADVAGTEQLPVEQQPQTITPNTNVPVEGPSAAPVDAPVTDTPIVAPAVNPVADAPIEDSQPVQAEPNAGDTVSNEPLPAPLPPKG